jgi:hypothetical protein
MEPFTMFLFPINMASEPMHRPAKQKAKIGKRAIGYLNDTSFSQCAGMI